MANCHRRRNCLTKIKINGTWLVKEHEIHGGVTRAFQNLLMDPGDWRPSLNGLVFEIIEGENVARLEEALLVKEIVSALSNLSGDKASGPDGYPLAF